MSFIKKYNSTYSIDFYDTPISLNALITLLAGIIVAMSMVIFAPESYQVAGIFILLSLIGAYEINCFEFGKCSILAWGMAIIYVIYASGVLYAIYNVRSNPSEMQRFLKSMNNSSLF